jgi:hypothetical protein
VRRLQGLSQQAGTRDKLKNAEIPTLQAQIREKEGELPEAASKAEEVVFTYR